MNRGAAAAGWAALLLCAETRAAIAAPKPSAQLTLQQVFGAAATSLTVNFGTVDAACVTPPATGITCAADRVTVTATWYGNVQFTVVLSNMSGHTVRLAGVRPSAGSLPAGLLLDGVSSSAPSTAYPISPTSAIVLATGIPNGTTTVTRSIGVKVRATDAAGAWSTQVVYSLIVE